MPRGQAMTTTFLIVIYAALIPPANGDRIQFKAHPMASLSECNDQAKRMKNNARAGKLLAFCWNLKE